MKIITLVVGQHEANCYIVYDENSKEALLIDPGSEKKRCHQALQKLSLKLIGIVLTHGHHDHIGAADALRKQYTCPIMAHKKELPVLSSPDLNYSNDGSMVPIAITCDRPLTDGDTLILGTYEWVVIHTPGHTPGGMCLLCPSENVIFTGDTVFSDDIGRTDLKGGDAAAMKRSIQNKVMLWSDSLIVYPGHGDPEQMDKVKGYLKQLKTY